MTNYLKKSELFWPINESDYNINETLPTGTYSVGIDPERGWFLKPITGFDIKGKIYGKSTQYANRILNTFHDRVNATGVLLAGEKGSGKTLLAKQISMKALESDIPTLVINTPLCGESFNTFIQSITQPVIVIFDEFEKIYDKDDQEKILTLLDGVFPTKKLFILTVNDKWSIDSNMRNRPGRIFYMLEYAGLEESFIKEYCADNLDNKEHIQQICRLASLFNAFNFDMLAGLCQECNRYNETPREAMEMLNIKPFDSSKTEYAIDVIYNGRKYDKKHLNNDTFCGNPLMREEYNFWFNPNLEQVNEDSDDSEEDSIFITLTPDNLKNVNAETGVYTYHIIENGKPIVVTLTREMKSPMYDWRDAF